MTLSASDVIDGLGGVSTVARLIKAPTSTVHSWRKNGIPPARLDHLRLAAKEAGIPMPDGQADTSGRNASSPGIGDEVTEQVAA